MSQVVDTLQHDERLIEKGNDPYRDPPALQAYMARWDGPRFWEAMGDLAGRARIGMRGSRPYGVVSAWVRHGTPCPYGDCVHLTGFSPDSYRPCQVLTEVYGEGR